MKGYAAIVTLVTLFIALLIPAPATQIEERGYALLLKLHQQSAAPAARSRRCSLASTPGWIRSRR